MKATVVGPIVSLKKNICLPVEAVGRAGSWYSPRRPTEVTPAHDYFLIPILVPTEAWLHLLPGSISYFCILTVNSQLVSGSLSRFLFPAIWGTWLCQRQSRATSSVGSRSPSFVSQPVLLTHPASLNIIYYLLCKWEGNHIKSHKCTSFK